MRTPTLCLLGGTGFVGRHLTNRLTGEGWRVRIPTRNLARHREMRVLPRATLVQGDVYDRAFLQQVLEECDAAINLVGILNEHGRDGSGFRRAHVELTATLIEACRAAGVTRILQMSALKADATNGPSHYLRSKGEAENLVRRASGMRSTVLQPSTIFGPDDSFINRFAGLVRLPSYFIPLPRANARLQPVYVADVVEAFMRCLGDAETQGKTYQLGGPEVYSLRELVQLIARSLGVRRKVVSVSDGMARVMAAVLDFAPNKPFSTDNYLSLTVNSIADKDGLAQLGIDATSSLALIPRLVRREFGRSRLDTYRAMPDRRG